jgi:protein-disulfide isomerase
MPLERQVQGCDRDRHQAAIETDIRAAIETDIRAAIETDIKEGTEAGVLATPRFSSMEFT